MLSWIVCSTHQVSRFAQLPEYREYLSQSLSAFERKSEKNCRRSEQVGMRILEDRSAPQGKNIWTAVNCHSMSFVQATTFWLLTYLKLQKACSITTAWHQLNGKLRGVWDWAQMQIAQRVGGLGVTDWHCWAQIWARLLFIMWDAVQIPTGQTTEVGLEAANWGESNSSHMTSNASSWWAMPVWPEYKLWSVVVIM